jgi:hypothetical protein
MTVTGTEFRFQAHLEAWENGKKAFDRDYSFDVPRDHV